MSDESTVPKWNKVKVIRFICFRLFTNLFKQANKVDSNFRFVTSVYTIINSRQGRLPIFANVWWGLRGGGNPNIALTFHYLGILVVFMSKP